MLRRLTSIPGVQQAENDEPGSVQYNYQVWRQQRNERVLAETRSQAEHAGCSNSSDLVYLLMIYIPFQGYARGIDPLPHFRHLGTH